MHYASMEQQIAVQSEREKENAIRLAKHAGVADPERRIEPDMPATIRFGDPQLAELLRQTARNDLTQESLAKLDAALPEDAMADAPKTSLEEVDGIGPDLARELEANGYSTPDEVREASDEELLAIDGIGKQKLSKIREAL